MFFNTIFSKADLKIQTLFLAKQTDFGKIFSSTTYLTKIFSKKHSKDKPVY